MIGADLVSEEFEVRGVHEERMDAAAEIEPGGMAGQLAVMTAILATVGAMFSYMAGSTQADAGLFKNDAAIKKTEASNQWNFYQAKSSKQNLSELGMQLSDNAHKAFFEGEAKRYKMEKAEIKLAAEKFEKASTDFDEKSEALMHQHHRWAEATTVLQIAIAMAAIALLTRKRWLEKAVFVMTGVGLVVGALAYLHI
jgi:Na+/glutamate symporter